MIVRVATTIGGVATIYTQADGVTDSILVAECFLARVVAGGGVGLVALMAGSSVQAARYFADDAFITSVVVSGRSAFSASRGANLSTVVEHLAYCVQLGSIVAVAVFSTVDEIGAGRSAMTETEEIWSPACPILRTASAVVTSTSCDASSILTDCEVGTLTVACAADVYAMRCASGCVAQLSALASVVVLWETSLNAYSRCSGGWSLANGHRRMFCVAVCVLIA